MGDLVTDARFASSSDRRADVNGPALHAELEAALVKRARDEWVKILQDADVVCAPFQWPEEVVRDAQVQPALVEIPAGAYHNYPIATLPSPVDFSPAGIQTVMHPTGSIPGIGEHTEAALREAGVAEEDISEVVARAKAAAGDKPIYRGKL